MDEFEINIAKNHRHWGRIILSSSDTQEIAEGKLWLVRKFFTQPEGFEVSLSVWNRVGRTIDI